jgi:D-beta-D-heptose 7-phosphate kinase/D-beta-D-heptose 1-phosphate adenosyltransferase
MSLVCKDQPPVHIPTRAREVYDVSGAGDTAIATLGVAMACGKNPYEATILSNAAAGVVVRKLGAATVSPAELRRAMQRQQQDPWAGIMDEEELLQEVADARAHGEKIVMTNGCFDILHAGHITYLEQAKSLGQRLIVAVNDDASVAKLKGAGRPLNPLKQRMLVLSALRAVDWVVPFSEDTPERLITRVTPDILVKGGDYKVDQIAGARHVINSGGEVKILTFVEGASTTTLINRIKEEE